jgi:hypothetical protein
VLAGLEQALRQPAGFASYGAVRQWSKQRYQLDVNYHPLYTIVRTRFNARHRVPRPSHTKNPDAIRKFQATCQVQIQGVIPPENTHPVHIFSQDESRCGSLRVRRRLTAYGVRPAGVLRCQSAALPPAQAGGQVTPGRSVPHHRR